jgi:hypothetical protein
MNILMTIVKFAILDKRLVRRGSNIESCEKHFKIFCRIRIRVIYNSMSLSKAEKRNV